MKPTTFTDDENVYIVDLNVITPLLPSKLKPSDAVTFVLRAKEHVYVPNYFLLFPFCVVHMKEFPDKMVPIFNKDNFLL